MRPRYWFLAGLAVLLGIGYLALFTDWLHAAPIGIVAQIRQANERGFGPAAGGGPGQGNRRNRNVGAGQTGGTGQRDRGTNRSRPEAGQPGAGEPPAGVYPVSFTLDDNYQLTSVKVVKAGTREVLWHLIADGKQAPTKAFIYGQRIRSMGFADDNRMAEPLQPDVSYELQVAAGRHKGKIIFQTKELRPPEEPAP